MTTKALIIAEKPSVARDIVHALGGFQAVHETPRGVGLWESSRFICTHALGHLLDLYEPEDYQSKFKQWRLQDLPIVPPAFLTKPKSQTAQLLRTIKHQINRPDVIEVINACDAAREGELIFREILQHAVCDKKISRVWLQSMTGEAIRTAVEHRRPGEEYQGLANAAHGRSQADWLIGMNLTRAATLTLSRASDGGVWPIGRVQTPTLALLAEREFAILSHVPKPYEQIKATFQASDHQYVGTWFNPHFKPPSTDPSQPSDLRRDRIFSGEHSAQLMASLAVGQRGDAKDVRKSREQLAPPLFSLTALQRFMGQRHKWTAKQTLDIAQKCYEQHKVLTYPRTESEALPTDYRPKVRQLFEKLQEFDVYGTLATKLLTNTWYQEGKVFNDANVSDHFAIIPTAQVNQSLWSSLPKDEKTLVDAVIRRLLASLMPPAVIDQVDRTTMVNGQYFYTGPDEFTRILGWQEAWLEPTSRRKESLGLKPLAISEVTLTAIRKSTEETKPPPRITEPQLLSMMEHAGRRMDQGDLDKNQMDALKQVLNEAGGLGTAATRAEIIENLKNRDYVYPNLQPTVKGLHLIRFLKLSKTAPVTSAQLTAELESHLNLVQTANRSRDSFIGEVTKVVTQSLQTMTTFDLDRAFDHAPALGACPRCRSSVHERMWNYSCISNRTPDQACKFHLPKDCDGRWIDPATAANILNATVDGSLVDGFPVQTPSGMIYMRRRLRFKNGLLELLNEDSSPVAMDHNQALHQSDNHTSAKRRVTWGTCPVHQDDVCLIVETKNAFICETKLRLLRQGHMDTMGFQLPKSICNQQLKFEDINAFIKDGKTRVIPGFKSKSGKIFDASVIRKPSGQWEFDFKR